MSVHFSPSLSYLRSAGRTRCVLRLIGHLLLLVLIACQHGDLNSTIVTSDRATRVRFLPQCPSRTQIKLSTVRTTSGTMPLSTAGITIRAIGYAISTT